MILCRALYHSVVRFALPYPDRPEFYRGHDTLDLAQAGRGNAISQIGRREASTALCCAPRKPAVQRKPLLVLG